MKSNIFNSSREGENRVTASMLAVFERLDLSVLERLLASAAGESSLSLVEFANRPADGSSHVPDAAIRGSFNYLFEVKTETDAVRRDELVVQLRRLANGHREERLFVVTPDLTEPDAVAALDDDRVIWFSFLSLSQAIGEILTDETEGVSERAEFLLRELRALFADDGLLSAEDVVVVAARRGYQEYRRYHAYICQAGRSFRSVPRMAFYAGGAIQPEVPAILAIRDNIVIAAETAESLLSSGDETDRQFGVLIGRLLAEGGRPEGGTSQIFLLTPPGDERTAMLSQPIRNVEKDQNGQPADWTQNQRYACLEVLMSGIETTAELKAAPE
ncbi:MAG: hypothetical protein JSV86_14265 [Gemmatimonadota bacterium]|nr:MAG: hypothetical protein JSV86_14265 [Gemmatimonadota bacterium]